MKHMRLIRYSAAALSLSLFLFVSAAQAQTAHTYVSGVGDDANPCSRTAPCKTFAGAISKTSAAGQIDVLDPGGFGSVTITKSITLDGTGLNAIILNLGPNGILINAGLSDVVTIRNITIQGQGSGTIGVRLLQAKALHLENCLFTGNTGNGIDIEPSSPMSLFVEHTSSRDNGGNGLFIQGTMASIKVFIIDSHFENNALNGFLGGSFTKTVIRASDATANAGAGFSAQAASGPATLGIVNSIASFNAGAGIQAGGTSASSVVRLNNVTSFANGSTVANDSNGSILSYGNNYLTGAGSSTGTLAPQ